MWIEGRHAAIRGIGNTCVFGPCAPACHLACLSQALMFQMQQQQQLLLCYSEGCTSSIALLPQFSMHVMGVPADHPMK